MTDLDIHIARIILLSIDAYYSILFIYIILSLLQSFGGMTLPDVLRPAARFVHDISEPFLRLFRRLLPSVRLGGMGLDLSPILAFLTIRFIVRPIAESLIRAFLL